MEIISTVIASPIWPAKAYCQESIMHFGRSFEEGYEWLGKFTGNRLMGSVTEKSNATRLAYAKLWKYLGACRRSTSSTHHSGLKKSEIYRKRILCYHASTDKIGHEG
jgi:hypothetical protein